jgi:hypothetical protein
MKTLKANYRLTRSYPPRDWLVAHFEEEADLDFLMKLVEEAWRA